MYHVKYFSLFLITMEELKLGEHPKNTYWTVRGDTGVPAHHIDKFYKCGVSFKEYKGTVWVIRSCKILRPFDTVTKDHIELFAVYDNYKLNNEPSPSEEYNGPLPFSTFAIVDYTAMAIVGGDGPRSYWSHNWSNDVLHVYTSYGVTTYNPFGNSVAPGNNSPLVKPSPEPTPNNNKNNLEPDEQVGGLLSDGDDDNELYDLFG